MGQYRFAGWRLSSSSSVMPAVPSAAVRVGTRCGNTAGGRAGLPQGVWTVGAPAAGRMGGRAADTARWASRVTSH